MGASNSCPKPGSKETHKKTTAATTTKDSDTTKKKTTEAKPLDTRTTTTATVTNNLKNSLKDGPFIWRIDGFSSLLKHRDRTYQTGFEMQGNKWVLGVIPMDTKSKYTNSEEHLSLFLSLSKTLTNCMVDSKFKFIIYDQMYGEHIECEARHTYMMNNSRSGSLCMVPLKTLNDASSKFVVKDTIAVGVEITQVKTLPCSMESTNLIQNDKSSGSHSWYIEDFSKLNRPAAVSTPFQMAGYTWTLTFYPEGDRDKNYVALYLTLDTSKSQLPSSSSIMVDGDFFIKKESGENYTCNMCTNFHENHKGWGATKFMKLENFKDPLNGYLIKGTCTIGVSMCISGSSIGHT